MQSKAYTLETFIHELSSKAPVPGGGSVAALAGSLSAALASMAANLTSGKKKYAAYQADIERILDQTAVSSKRFLDLIEADAQAFLPLSKAYGIPKTDPERPQIMEAALRTACEAPFAVIQEAQNLLVLLEELTEKGSRLVVSDVGVAASCCRCAAESAALNVYINTKMMTDRDYAEKLNHETETGVQTICRRSETVYQTVQTILRRNTHA